MSDLVWDYGKPFVCDSTHFFFPFPEMLLNVHKVSIKSSLIFRVDHPQEKQKLNEPIEVVPKKSDQTL